MDDVGVEGLLGHGGVAMAVRMFSVDGGCGWAYKWRAARPWKDARGGRGNEMSAGGHGTDGGGRSLTKRAEQTRGWEACGRWSGKGAEESGATSERMVWETRQRAVMAACARERGGTSFASRAFVAPHWRQPPATRFSRAGGGKGLGRCRGLGNELR